jgi:hypothetical protein
MPSFIPSRCACADVVLASCSLGFAPRMLYLWDWGLESVLASCASGNSYKRLNSTYSSAPETFRVEMACLIDAFYASGLHLDEHGNTPCWLLMLGGLYIVICE